MNHTLLTLLCLVSSATLFANPESAQEAPKEHSWSKNEKIYYYLRSWAPTAVATAASLATSFVIDTKLQNHTQKIVAGTVGNYIGLRASTGLTYMLVEREIQETNQLREKHFDQTIQVPFSAASDLPFFISMSSASYSIGHTVGFYEALNKPK